MARDTLTPEKIVRAAIKLLDEEGLEGLTMRDLGARLESAATAIYWHVKNKEDLIRLAGDELWYEIDLPDPAGVGWRKAGTSMAKHQYAMLTRHPWLMQAMGSHVLYGPGKARHDDHNLAVYEFAGFLGTEADQAAAIVFMFVLGSALGSSASAALRAQLRRHGADAQQRMREVIAEQTTMAMQFPRLRARIEMVDGNGNDYYAAPENSFEIGLVAVFVGLEQRLGAGVSARAGRSR